MRETINRLIYKESYDKLRRNLGKS